MKEYKNRIITALLIVTALAAAWFYGGNYNGAGGATPSALAQGADTSQASVQASAATALATAAEPSAAAALPGANDNAATSAQSADAPAASAALPGADDNAAAESSAAQSSPGDTAPAASSMTLDPKTGKDRYLTDPVPEGKPTPVEPQDAVQSDDSFTVTLSVHCGTILDNMNLLHKEKHELIPADGVIYPATEVTAYEGESVFNILQRTMKQERIHMTFRNTPIYNSAYIEAIQNLYEFDVGELSGWMYCVTPRATGQRWYPNYGCSRYQLSPGDVIEWNYTCDLGRDLGEFWLGARQLDD